jgi:hypothetical protein
MLKFVLFGVVAIVTYFAESLFPFLVPQVNLSLLNKLD